ncbi:unnamed protein product [Caretta caretta]
MLMLHTIHFLTHMSYLDTQRQDMLLSKEDEELWLASCYLTLVPWPTRDISWWLLHGAVSTGIFLQWFLNSHHLYFLQPEGDPCTQIYRACQATATLVGPPEPLNEVLAALFLTCPALCTPYPWPHKVTRPPHQPPPGDGQVSHLSYQEEEA